VVTPEMTSYASSSKQISLEVLPSLNPDVLFVDAAGLALCQQNYADNPSLYDGISAFQTGEIYMVMPFNYYSANYDTLLADCYYVASIMYPDAFDDVNIVEKSNEIYSAFLDVPVYSLVAANYMGGFQQLSSLE
jgi:iron complex transport system substrate-binding protein